MDNKSKRNKVEEQLSKVIDPEFDVDVLSLGLIYDVKIQEEDVTIKMTLTSRGCPFQTVFDELVTNKVSKIDWVENVEVNLTFDPPWSPDKMDEKARQKMGSIPGHSSF